MTTSKYPLTSDVKGIDLTRVFGRGILYLESEGKRKKEFNFSKTLGGKIEILVERLITSIGRENK